MSFISTNVNWPGLRHGFPFGTLLTPVTRKFPVSSSISMLLRSDWTSTTVPCIQTTESRNKLALFEPSLLITYSDFPFDDWHSFPSRSWLDNTFTGGHRVLSPHIKLAPIIFFACWFRGNFLKRYKTGNHASFQNKRHRMTLQYRESN